MYIELEEPELETRRRFAAMLRARGAGPDNGNLHFLSREDLCRWRVLPHELLRTRVRDFGAMLKDAGAELVVLVALRKFVAPGENLKDPDVAEALNNGVETLRLEVGCAIAMAHHDRKSAGDTIESQGFGSTFLSAAADGIFDLERADHGVTRKVRVEARYSALDCFHLRKEMTGDGEVIRFADPPMDPNVLRFDSLQSHLQQGKSLRKAAEAAGVPWTTARRWKERN